MMGSPPELQSAIQSYNKRGRYLSGFMGASQRETQKEGSSIFKGVSIQDREKGASL